MPFLQIDDLQKIWACINENILQKEKLIVAPFLGKRKGNPVFFSRYYFPEILNHKEPNGCKDLIKKEIDHLTRTPILNKNAFQDIDVPEDLNKSQAMIGNL